LKLLGIGLLGVVHPLEICHLLREVCNIGSLVLIAGRGREVIVVKFLLDSAGPTDELLLANVGSSGGLD